MHRHIAWDFLISLLEPSKQIFDYPQDCQPQDWAPQDCPLVGNSEVGNPEYTSHQDCPPQLLCCLCIVCE